MNIFLLFPLGKALSGEPSILIQSSGAVPKVAVPSCKAGALGDRPGSVPDLLCHLWQVISLSSGPLSPHLLNQDVGLHGL